MKHRLLLLSSLALLSSPFLQAQQTRGPGPPDVGIDQKLNELVPLELRFLDEKGKVVRLQDYFDTKPVILVLAYYKCPRLCSLVLNKLVESLNNVDYQIGKEFTIVTVSFDPREGPELAAAKKTAYVQAYARSGAEAGWHFLTGNDDSIKRLTAAVGFRYTYDPDKDQYAHASGFMVLTPGGRIARYFYGLDYPARDLAFALEDASSGRIGSPVTRPLRLLCFAYDPVTGKYTLMTMRLVQGAGILTVLFVGLFLVRSWRRSRGRVGRPGHNQRPGHQPGLTPDS
jgi:protein SCO1/2